MLSHKKRKIESITERLDSLEIEQLMLVDDLLEVFGYSDDNINDDEDNDMSDSERRLLDVMRQNLDDELEEDDGSLGEFTTDLMAIVKDSDIELVKYVLDNNKMIMINAQNEKGITPLMWACACNSIPEVIEKLIKHKAKIDTVDNKGRTAIHHLAENFNGHLILTPLIEAGADLNVKDDDGNTPIKLAIKEEHHETALALLKAGAKIEDLDI